MKIKIVNSGLFMITIFLLFIFFDFNLSSEVKSKKNLTFDVNVNAVIVPLFATDKKGEPVFDLKIDDLRLYVEGKPVNINALSRYSLKEEEKYSESVKKTLNVPLHNRGKFVWERYIFVIIDSVFNSRDGFRRTKEIAEKLIDQGGKGDKFIVVEIHPLKGLHYIGGPETGKEKLIEKIKELKLNFDRWSNDLFRQKMLGSNLSNSIYDFKQQESKRFLEFSKEVFASERAQYKNHFIRYVKALSRFKYVLKSIIKPKIVYLISEGIAQGNFIVYSKGFTIADANDFNKKMTDKKRESPFWSILWNSEHKDRFKMLFSGIMLRYLRDVVKAINRGNSVLYSINPAKPTDTHLPNVSGVMSLKYLANESGGQYYAGTDTVKIIEGINKSTSAYYELSFLIPDGMKDNLHVKVRCMRTGVRVNTVKYTELKKKYSDMDKLQKRVFAYNLAKGGKWSRLISKAIKDRIDIKKISSRKEDTFSFNLPEVFKRKVIDFYIITEDIKNFDVKIKKRGSIVLKDRVEVKVNKEKNKKNYIVMVEPGEIYSFSVLLEQAEK